MSGAPSTVRKAGTVRAAGDAIPDSDATLGARERIRAQLRPRFNELLRAFAVDHGNWDEMDTRAQELGGEASRQLNIIRQEITYSPPKTFGTTASNKK